MSQKELQRLRQESEIRYQDFMGSCKKIDTLNEALRAALAAMKAVEWSIPSGKWTRCPSCLRSYESGVGHAPDCQLAESINRVEGVLG